MSKAAIYISARAGGRTSPSVRESAWQSFVSTNGMVGSPELVAEIANRAFEHGMMFVMRDNRDGTVVLKRVSYVDV